jgi:hypothetical protein
MAAEYYCADSEHGHHIDDPSEDALFDLISELNDSDNTFIVIQPEQDDPAWFASVAVRPCCPHWVTTADSATPNWRP